MLVISEFISKFILSIIADLLSLLNKNIEESYSKVFISSSDAFVGETVYEYRTTFAPENGDFALTKLTSLPSIFPLNPASDKLPSI